MRRVPPLAAFVALVALAAGTAVAPPDVEAATHRLFPTQTLGDRGTDVTAIQLLLRDHGAIIASDGLFGPSTKAAVVAFQSSAGLAADGRVGPATWARLIRSLAIGGTGPAVMALQFELHRKRRVAIPAASGTFGAATRDAVRAFQRHMGLPVTGIVGATVWRELVWHYELPVFDSKLCDYSTGDGPANWGTAELVGSLRAIAVAARAAHFGSVSLGDASLEHGGNIAGHETHEVGLDMDILAIRHDRRACSGTNWRASTYDRAATIALIKLIRATDPGHIKVIYFDDPVLIAHGYTRYKVGHDDHIHVRFCEAAHPDPHYVCPSG